MSHDRKAQSAEPSTAFSAAYGAYGKRWEDLIDAATSATEDVDDDRTPVSLILRKPPCPADKLIGTSLACFGESCIDASVFCLALSRIPSLAFTTGTHPTIIYA
jgi:hypothetical protein